jgi:hypothetical protein
LAVGHFTQNNYGSQNNQAYKSGIYFGDIFNREWSHNFILKIELIHPETNDIKVWADSYDNPVDILSSTSSSLLSDDSYHGFRFFCTKSNTSQFAGYILHDVKIEEVSGNGSKQMHPNAKFELDLHFHGSSSNTYPKKLGTLYYTQSTNGVEESVGGSGRYWWGATSRSWDAE